MANKMKAGGKINKSASGGKVVLAGRDVIYSEKVAGHNYGHEE
jgi:hypothetical protein